MHIHDLLNPAEREHRVGLIHKTLALPPTVFKVHPARIRSKYKDDWVAVGEDFIHLYQTDYEGNISHIATKDDFDCKITSSDVIGHFDPYKNEAEEDEEDVESATKSVDGPLMAPQMLVLVLETSQLVFLTARETGNGAVKLDIDFDASSCIRMPKFPTPSQKLGKHLAIDPYSRALAVAAVEDNIFLCSAKQAELLSVGQRWGDGFLPVSSSRIVNIKAQILLMDFLPPKRDDPDRVLLLLIALQDKHVRPVLIEWSHELDVQSADVKLGHKIPTNGELPNLLVPLQNNAAFLLAYDTRLCLYENILTGYVKPTPLSIDREPPPDNYPPSSARPRWAGFVRPRRDVDDPEAEYLFMFTEDGHIHYLMFDVDTPNSGFSASHIAHLECHIDSAYAPFGKSTGGDVLIVFGVQSEGGVFMTECRQAPTTDEEPRGGMEAFKVVPLPNWSRNYDLTARYGSRKQALPPYSRHALFAPSGCQPYGHISELRMGLDARSGFHLEDDIEDDLFENASQAWVLPILNEIFLMLSSPMGTRIMSISQTVQQLSQEESHELIGLDTDHPTLAAKTLRDDYVFQVSEKGLFVAKADHEGLLAQPWPEGTRVTAAAIHDTLEIAIISLQVNGTSQLGLLRAHIDAKAVALTTIGSPVEVEADIISLAVQNTSSGPIAVAGTSDGVVQCYRLHPQRGLVPAFEHTIPRNPDNIEALIACESLVVLCEPSRPTDYTHLLIICGLRGGSIYVLEIQGDPTSFQPASGRHYTLGLTTVKLEPDANNYSAFAACGNGLFNLTLFGKDIKSLRISDVWLTSTQDKELRQEAMSAFSVVPSIEASGLSSALILVTGGDCFITAVSKDSTIVPRNIESRGSPHVLIESRRLNCLVSAATHTRLRSPTTRTIQEIVEFTSPEHGWSFSHPLQAPGFKVYSMIEWSYKNAEGKPYYFIALAGGLFDSDSKTSKSGRIIFLQPSLNNGKVDFVKELTVKTFDSKVLSIATYGEWDLVACVGSALHFLAFHPEGKKFEEVCSHETRTVPIHVTTEPPHIHITTASDSTITLQLISTSNPPTPPQRRLAEISSETHTRMGGTHLTLSLTHKPTTTTKLNLASTRNGQILGLRIPSPTTPIPKIARSNPPLFATKMRRSQMRIVQAKVRQPWKPQTVQGILDDELIGIAVDGAITGFAILDETTTQRLRWVQRLCQRSDEICSYTKPAAVVPHNVVLPPAGFGEEGKGVRMMHVPEDMCIDGDVLQRLVERGGADLLKRIMKEEAQKNDDPMARWMSDNLEAQLSEVGSLMDMIEVVVDRWF